MLTPFPSATAFALALGARLTLRGLTLRRNPWTFGVRVSHPHYRYSCQHSHFRSLQRGSRPPFAGLRNAPLPRQDPGTRSQGSGRTRPACVETTQHPADLTIAVTPPLTHNLLEITEIDAVAQPQLRLIATANRGQQIAPILRRRITLLGETLGQVRADRFRCAAQLVLPTQIARSAEPSGWLDGALAIDGTHAQRHRDLRRVVFLARSSNLLAPDSWFLVPDTRSFGARLEPRYIFGAGRLIDQ
jgi:hypothetical protein